MTAPEWLVPGARVATVTRNRDGWAKVQFANVDRVGKRDVVLDDEQRFNVNRLVARFGGTWSSTDVALVAADAPIVTEARTEIARRNTIQKARNACQDFGLGGSARGSSLSAAEVILALAPLTGVADEIAALLGEQIEPDEGLES